MTLERIVRGERVTIRPLNRSDAELITEYLQESEVRKWLRTLPTPYKRKHALEFIATMQKNTRKGNDYVFGIVNNEEKKLVGCIGLHNVDRVNKSAELGYWLAKPYWGKGYMTESVSLSLKFAFSRLKMHRVWAGVYKPNKVSARVLEKLGFKYEGTEREAVRKRGKWLDALKYAILKNEFKK